MFEFHMFTINCKGQIFSLDKPQVMGIINITPDSFYKGFSSKDLAPIDSLAEKMINDGAQMLDIGGQSTRPGSKRIELNEELDRVIPVINHFSHKFPGIILSIDTYYSKVAREAVNAGASIINDISAGEMDEEMLPLVASLRVPYVCMHMQGRPETMQQNPEYSNVVTDVMDYLAHKVYECRAAGINDLIIDPGFGFGKTRSQNFKLLHNLQLFTYIGCPILVGLSRKGMIYKTIGGSAGEALNGTTALNMVALTRGANILRVHDVKEAVDCIKLWEELSTEEVKAWPQ